MADIPEGRGAIETASLSKTIELTAPTQVLCTARGACGASAATYFRLTTQIDGGDALVVAQTMVDPQVRNETLALGASMFLPAGRHTWRAAFGANAGTPKGPDVKDLQLTRLDAPPGQGVAGQFVVAGATGGFFLVRAGRDVAIYPKLELWGEVPPDRQVSMSLVAHREADLLVASYPSVTSGRSQSALKIDGGPFWLEGMVTYRFDYTLSPMPIAGALAMLGTS